jgi:hypothetical protein
MQGRISVSMLDSGESDGGRPIRKRLGVLGEMEHNEICFGCAGNAGLDFIGLESHNG